MNSELLAQRRKTRYGLDHDKSLLNLGPGRRRVRLRLGTCRIVDICRPMYMTQNVNLNSLESVKVGCWNIRSRGTSRHLAGTFPMATARHRSIKVKLRVRRSSFVIQYKYFFCFSSVRCGYLTPELIYFGTCPKLACKLNLMSHCRVIHKPIHCLVIFLCNLPNG